MKIISFCHPANVTPAALICAVAKAFSLTNMQAKEAMQPEGDAWRALCEEIEGDAKRPDPRDIFAKPSATGYNDAITDLHTDERGVYIVPINTDPACAILRCLLLSSVEAVELGQQVWGWDGSALTFITKASDAECEISA